VLLPYTPFPLPLLIPATPDPPEITNVQTIPPIAELSEDLMIMCDVVDDDGVSSVKVNIDGPNGFKLTNVTMNNDGGDTYYYEQNTHYNI